MTTATSTRIQTGTWSLDPVHSVAGFRVKHFGLTWLRGKFNEFELQLVAGDDGRLQVTGGAPVEAISFPNEQLHGHLMSPDFFDVQLHPRIEFASTDVELADDGTASITGTLTIKGTALPVALTGTWSGPVEGLGGDTRIGLEVTGEIDRDAYGVSWQAQLPTGQDVVSRAVKLEGEFELALQA
jgi:polyisoprenoid-binding protein YceI